MRDFFVFNIKSAMHKILRFKTMFFAQNDKNIYLKQPKYIFNNLLVAWEFNVCLCRG